MNLRPDEYEELMRIYSGRQLADRRRQEERAAEAAGRLPALASFDAEIMECAREQARLSLSGDAFGAQDMAAKLAGLNEERKALLVSAGFPADWTDMHYVCPVCRDTGMVNGETCECFRREVSKLFVRRSNLGPVLAKDNFSAYTDAYYPDEPLGDGTSVKSRMTAAARTIRAYADDFEKKGGNMLFTGPAGVGKTFFARCVAAELLERGIEVVYVTASDLRGILTDSLFRDRGTGAAERAEDLQECALLIIDDLGTEAPTDSSVSRLYSLLEGRMTRGLATIITTNLSPEDIRDIYTERIFSRLMGGFLEVPMTGDDIRLM